MVWSAVTDFASEAAGAVGDFFTGGGGQAASNAGEAMAQAQLGNAGSSGGALGFAGDLFSGAARYAGSAFNWMGDNPEAANALGGIAVGAGQGYIESRNARKDRELERELQRERLEAEKIAPGSMGDNYGSYGAGVTRGLISDGMLARDEENA